MNEDPDDYEPSDDGEMPWEYEARRAIQAAVKNAERDEIRGVIYLWCDHDHKFNLIQKEFKRYDDLYYALTEIGETEWINYVPYDGGPVFEADVENIVADALDKLDADNFFFRRRSSFDNKQALFNAADFLTPQGANQLRLDTEEISTELIRYLAKNPSKMHELTSRKFEELVAELYRSLGYEVELTPASNDGGVDIRAIRKTEVGIGLYFIECKRYSTDNKVDVGIVRGLYGVVEEAKATGGVVVTTSFFTKGAFDFREKIKHRMALNDQTKLVEFLSNYKRG